MQIQDPNIDFQTFSFDILTGHNVVIPTPYNYFRVMTLSGASSIDVKFQEGSIQNIPASIGIGFVSSLSKLTLYNNSGSSVSVTISVANAGSIDDARATIGGTVQTKEVTDTISTGTETGTWSIVPEGGIKALTVRAGASDITVGDSAITLNFTIGAGESYTFKTTDTIHGSGDCSWIQEFDT